MWVGGTHSVVAVRSLNKQECALCSQVEADTLIFILSTFSGPSESNDGKSRDSRHRNVKNMPKGENSGLEMKRRRHCFTSFRCEAQSNKQCAVTIILQ